MLVSWRGFWRGGRSVSLRTYVTAAMLVVLLPLLGHAVLVTWYSYSASRHWAEKGLLGDAEHLADDVDARLDVSRSVMLMISRSPAARRGDAQAVRELIDSARGAGLIRAALVADTQGEVVVSTGFRPGAAASFAGAGASEQFLAGRMEEEPVLTAALPIASADPRLARLEFAISVSVLRAARGGDGEWPWHVTVVTDRQSQMVWSAQPQVDPAVLRQIHDPSVTGGVVNDWAAPDGTIHTIGYARAGRSGLTVVVAQPVPGLYERVPLGPFGAVAIAVGAMLLSVVLARLGAVQIGAAYRAAMGGGQAGPLRIDEAMRLGAELRSSRDRLFQAVGGIAVVEMTRAPGRRWGEAEVEASANIRTLMQLDPGEALTAERLMRYLSPEDRSALADTLAGTGGAASVFTRLVRTRPDGRSPRYFNLVGMLRETGPDAPAQLVLTLQDVTAQKETELELQAQASRLLLATEIAGLGVWERDPERGTGHASERLWEIMGREPHGTLDMPFFLEAVHPDDRARVAQAIRGRAPEEHAAPGGRPTQLRYRLLRPDGTVRHVRSSRVFVEDAGGGHTRVVGVLIDETEAVMAQRALAASEARFRLAVDVAELGVFERYIDPHRNVGVWNERMWRIRGLEPRAEPMQYDELLAMVHPDDRSRIVEEMRERRTRGDGTSNYEFRITRPDGQERIIQSRSVRTHLPEDHAISIVAINLDVTERRRAEQALQESAARLQLAVETAQLGFAQVDPATGQGMWSERLYGIYGLAPRAGRPSLDEVLERVHPDDRATMLSDLARQRAAPDERAVESAFRIVRPDGEERFLHVRSVRMHRADGSETVSTVTQDVTEQRRAEHVLVASEARLRLAVETAELGVAELDLASGAGVWNERQYRICGLEPSEGRPTVEELLALVHPEDRGMFAREVAALRMAPDGHSMQLDVRITRPDGAERVLHIHSATMRRAGSPAMQLTVTQDITERRQAERALADSEARMRLAVETAGLGVAERDLATGQSTWSAQMCRIMGVPADRQSFGLAEATAMIHPEDRDRIAAVRAEHAAAEDGFVSEYDFRMIRPDGQERILHSRSVTLRGADGAARMLSVNLDVTGPRRAEQALAESEMRLRLATEAAELGIWEYDVRSGRAIWTETSWRLRGMEVPAEGEGEIDVQARVVADDLGVWPSLRQRLAAGEEKVRYEYRIRLPDGTTRYLSGMGQPVRDAEGHVVRMVGVTSDVTAQREAEVALLDRTTTLELAIEAADLGIWTRDPGETSRQASARLWAMLGHAGREGPMTREELLACLHPDDREAVLREWVAADGLPSPRQREFRALWPDGTVRHIQSRRAVMRDATGRTIRVIGLIADVTEARRAAAALAASEMRLRLAVDAAELGIFDYDPETREGHWSERTWRMRGLAPRDGIPLLEEVVATLHPEDRARSGSMAERQFVVPDGARLEDEFRVVWPDGTVRHLLMRAVRHRGEDGRVRLFGINMDVTERRTAALALEASEARLRLAVDAAEMGVFEFDPDSRTGYWSERIWRMRGLEPRQGTLSFEEVIDLVHPADRDAVAARMREQFAAPDGVRGEYEFRIVRSDGAVRHIQSRAITQRRPDGGLHRLFGINIDITERRLAAQALEESETRLRLASEAAELGVFQVNMPEGTGHWSERMWRIRGLAPQPGLPGSETAVGTVHPDDRHVVRGLRKSAATWPHGEPVRQQYRVLWPDGTIRHVASYAVVLHGREEGAFSLIGVNLDITDQVVREQALRETAARYELAIDAAGLAVWDWDPATDRMAWSPRIWDIVGIPQRDEVPSVELRQRAVHPVDRERVPTAWIRSVKPGEERRGEDEFRVIRRDGSTRYLHWQGIPLHDGQGRIVRFAGVVADVTEARMAEMALRTSEELFRMAAEAAEQGVWNHDLVSGTITWSARLWRIHGLAPHDGAPSREERIERIHPEDREDVLRLADELHAAPPNTVLRRSYRIVRADGAVRTVDRQAMLVAGADGRPARIVGVVHDVTDARELAAQTMVADKLATLGEMAGAIAHELAQPLQAVMATAATARMRLTRDTEEATVERVCDRLAWIERQTARAGKTIQHLLAFSRGESSEGYCRLGDALEGAMELAGHGLRRDGVEVSVQLPEELPPVRGGQIAIEQVLVNLLNNARDAMADRTPRRIRIEARSDGDSVSLDVTDTGSGVPADKMERIFEPFYTTKPVGRGTGIGLSVARRTMHALGGAISVTNTGTGACFSLTFRSALVAS